MKDSGYVSIRGCAGDYRQELRLQPCREWIIEASGEPVCGKWLIKESMVSSAWAREARKQVYWWADSPNRVHRSSTFNIGTKVLAVDLPHSARIWPGTIESF
ncbi:hypothetical protein HBH98_008870 [Parastagonospora nodorum]|nr:hypothetical protein HBH98_008870 [Parastagonospora nodorum]KAH4430117.1 hypothetical protein HBH99_008930 [Parastagonospora nodorum]KAH4607216.1 hypothetical protein HBH82_088900 [Parastagonospora nodorum]KAH4714965.1 hypothetical protein HBH78_033850 [Parastagonospora nodorum]KAH4784929.1 hypothetical protein HBH62_090830 [Parastagonospora nodorum]